MDVVSAGNESDWLYPPFEAVFKDGNLYGGGTTDMKGDAVSLVLAMIELKEK